MTAAPAPTFIEIAVNLTDPIFRGIHRGKQKHQDDFVAVLQRARDAGVRAQITTGGSLSESKEALRLAKEHGLYATIGCHPTRSSEMSNYPESGIEGYLAALDRVISEHLSGVGRVVAVGECGLDYDRLHFSDAETQRRAFRSQLSLAKKHHLPLFLHSRAAHEDFRTILQEEGFGADGGRSAGARGGVVHSFTGTVREMNDLVEMGFHIGINGCSLKTEQLLEMVSHIPLDRIMLETDSPWCSLTGGHASKNHLTALPSSLKALYLPDGVKPEKFEEGKAVKGRNEPCSIGAIAWVVSQVKGIPLDEVAQSAWKSTVEVFGLQELDPYESNVSLAWREPTM